MCVFLSLHQFIYKNHTTKITKYSLPFYKYIFFYIIVNGTNLKNAIRIMIPIIAMRSRNWGQLYGSLIFGTKISTQEEQKKIDKKEERDKAKEMKEIEEGKKAGKNGWWVGTPKQLTRKLRQNGVERERERIWGENGGGGGKERYPWLVVGDHVLSKIMKIKRRGEEGEEGGVGREEWEGELGGKGRWEEGNRVGRKELMGKGEGEKEGGGEGRGEGEGGGGGGEKRVVGEWWVNGTRVEGWKRTKVGVVRVEGRVARGEEGKGGERRLVRERGDGGMVVWEVGEAREGERGRRGEEEVIEARKRDLEEKIRRAGKKEKGKKSMFEKELEIVEKMREERRKEDGKVYNI